MECAVNERCEKTLCPLTKVRFTKSGINKKGNRGKWHRSYKCANGYKRISKSEEIRPSQKVKNLNCYMKINMKWQDNGSCVITTCILEHNHPITERNFYCSKNRRKLSKDDENFVFDLVGAKASNRNIVEVLSQRIGKLYNTQDWRC